MSGKRPFYYILAEHTPVPLAGLEEWLDSVEYPATVAFTVIGTGYAVSTIFLGLVRQINQWFTAFPSSN